MRKIFTHQTEDYHVSLWQFDHITSLSNSEKSEFYRRFIRKELIKITQNPDVHLYFNENNKPMINDINYTSISISHTLNYLAFQLHKRECAGIDIETARQQLIKVQNKFLNSTEIQLAQNNLNYLCLLWTIKEALFKTQGTSNVSLKKNIQITHVNLPHITARIILNEKEKIHTLYSQQIHSLTVTYVVQ